jgi:diacylglycerol kinase family enzyme
MSHISAIVILNSRSGNGSKGDVGPELDSMAATLGVHCDIERVRTRTHLIQAARKAASSNCDVVIAAGGDGTVNAVANELVGTEKSLGVLPLGTFNYFAREMGLPTDLKAAFRTCFDGEIRSVTVGEVNDRMFLNNASIGLYPVILAAREQTYRRWGRTRFVAYWSVLRALLRLRLNMKLTITSDGKRRNIRTPLLFVARNATQLKEFRVPGARCIREDEFSVYALRPMGRLGLLRVAWHTLAGRLEPQHDFDMSCTSAIRVESERMLRTVALDGERLKMLAPIEFRVHQAALSVVVPKEVAEEAKAV